MKRFSALLLLATISALLPGCEEREEEPSPVPAAQEEQTESPRPGKEEIEVEIFFGTAGGRLGTEKRSLPAEERSEEEMIAVLIEELLAGPAESSSLRPALPSGTTLRAVYLPTADLAVVDLGGDALREWSTGSTAEMVATYAVVNTITGNMPEIEAVQILVEGREVETLAGHLDMSRPLRPRNL